MTPDATEHPADSWGDFCDLLEARQHEGVTQWHFRAGHAGLGVSVETAHGDGQYPVFVRRTADGRIAELKVVFV